MFARVTVLCLATTLCSAVFGGSLTVTVRDPAAASVADAVVDVTVSGGRVAEYTGADGRAVFDSIASGSWKVSVSKSGFDSWSGRVTVGERPASLAVSLKIAAVSTSMQVSGRRSALANSDPNYQALRTGKLSKVYRVSDLVLDRDAGVFTFRSGSFSFLPPVMGHVTVGVFVGDGNFQMTPEGELAARRMKRMMGSDAVSEDFTAAVIFFSDATFDEVKAHSEIVDESPVNHEAAYSRVKDVIESRRPPRSRGYPPSPQRTELELMLNWEDIPNYDAEILAEIYNGDVGEARGSFRAFLHGKKYPDLRFLINPHGALPMPMMNAPEEVTLLDFDPNSNADGIWYLSHSLAEVRSHVANSKEDKRLIAPEHYKMDVLIGDRNLLGIQPDLQVTCEMSFRAVQAGVKMAKLELMPDLQISRVVLNGNEIPFVQESRKNDGSFYLQMPAPLEKGRVYDVTFEYAGGEILQSRFDLLRPDRIWYPMPAGPQSRSTYDVTFHIPRGSAMVSTGELVRQEHESARWDAWQWKADVPITQALFHWVESADFRTEVEATSGVKMAMYRSLTANGIPAPSADYMLGDVGNALGLFTSWFGKPAFTNLTMLVQTGGFASSFPGLIYSAPFAMVGAPAIASRFGVALPTQVHTMLDEALPRLIAGQWWGNMVTPASFHDVWLIAGLTNFSASVYDLAARGREDDFKNKWAAAQEQIVSGTRSCARVNDAGPLWMGMLNNGQDCPAGVILNMQKGAYVMQMLRAMMWDPKTLDRESQAMMRDFAGSFANGIVSTEDFQAVVEKHMTPAMDLDGNHRLDWFFQEWVYGTDLPSYRLEYSFSPGENGAVVLVGKLTQSGVSPSFKMLVPVFADYGGKWARIDVEAMRGNSTNEFRVTLSPRPKEIVLNVNHDVLSAKDVVILAADKRR
jgi:hypothetical protein